MKLRIFFLLCICISLVRAGIPSQIGYQGKITNPAGVGINGPHNFEFRIYNAPSGGTLLWSEVRPGIIVTNGLFDVVLGTVTPINLSFDVPYWLEIWVDGEQMTPRTPLNSVGYAYRAKMADSTGAVNWTDIASIPSGFSDGIDNEGVTQIWQGAGISCTPNPITASGTVALTTTGVTPGTYTNATVSVDAYGRITSASSGSGGGTVTSISAGTPGSNTAGSGLTFSTNPITTTGSIALSNTGVTPGTYTNATITVDSQGRITSANSGISGAPTDASYVVMALNGTLTQERVLNAGAGLSLSDGGPNGNATISLTSTGVTPGTYTNATITVDSQGRITSASSGSVSGDNLGNHTATQNLNMQEYNIINFNYLNGGAISGESGYGLRDSAGIIQYKNSGGNWTRFPVEPPTGSTTEWWYKPSGTYYIRPYSNPNIRVYDSGQSYGFYYDGATNQYGGWFRTQSVTTPTSAVVGFSDVSGMQTYGYLGYVGDYPVGSAGTVRGSAVYGVVDDEERVAGFFRTTSNATYAANVNYSNVWIATYSYVDNATPDYNPPASYSQLNVTNSSLGGDQIALRGYSNRGTTSGNPGYTIGAQGVADAQNQDAEGVEGIAFSNASRSGGYFAAYDYNGTLQAYAYVASDIDGTNRKIYGTASVSEIIPTREYGRITMTCPEAPEYWYFDFGSGKVIDGKCRIELDPILVHISVIDEENPIKVIITPNGSLGGDWWVEKDYKGFTLIAPNARNGVSFDYQIVVKPKTNYGEGRFKQAPGPRGLKPENEPPQAKAANQTKGKKIFRWPPDWEVYGYDPYEMGIFPKPETIKATPLSEQK